MKISELRAVVCSEIVQEARRHRSQRPAPDERGWQPPALPNVAASTEQKSEAPPKAQNNWVVFANKKLPAKVVFVLDKLLLQLDMGLQRSDFRIASRNNNLYSLLLTVNASISNTLISLDAWDEFITLYVYPSQQYSFDDFLAHGISDDDLVKLVHKIIELKLADRG